MIGVAIRGNKASEALAMIEQAEQLGIHAAWMTTGGARLDSITVFAAAAVRTQRIKLGTSIVPTFPRHPLVMVQQAQVVAQLAPGRFRLGVGPSHRPTIEAMGIQFTSPPVICGSISVSSSPCCSRAGWILMASTIRPMRAFQNLWTCQ